MADKCKYCGNQVQKYMKMCGNCYIKLKLIREIRQRVFDYKAMHNKLELNSKK